MCGDTAKGHIFLDTFRSRLTVGNGIAGSAVEQSVIAAGGAGGKIEAFHQQHFKTAHGAVAGSTCTGSAGADDNDVVVLRWLYAVCHNEVV